MKTAQPLSITPAALASIKRMAGAARGDRLAGRELHHAIRALPFNQQAELLALLMLGRSGGHNSFNRALEAASRQNPAHIAGMLAEKSNLGVHLARGLKRYNRQA